MTILDQLVAGAIDLHVHPGPDPMRERRLDALDIAYQARQAGMRAVVIKSHHYCTAPVASIVNQVVTDFSLVGSLVLNRDVGGLSQEVVEIAICAGSKIIWMPTISSVIDTRRIKEESQYPLCGTRTSLNEAISLIDEDGKLVPEMTPILEMIKRGDVLLATGHISVPEIYAVVEASKSRQIKVLITHPLTTIVGSPLTVEQQKELVNQGAYIEHCFNACLPPEVMVSPGTIVDHIRAVGIDHCVLSTDLGQYYNPIPAEGFRMMLANMLMSGLSETELEILTKINPAKLLGLD